MVKRVLHLGFEVRIELVLQDGQEIWAQVSRNEIERLDVEAGQAIYIRPSREKVSAERCAYRRGPAIQPGRLCEESTP